MNDVPWYFKSHSIFTLIVWTVLIVWGTRQLLKNVKYKRWKRLVALTDSIFVLGLVVLPLDLMWVLVCGLRFGMMFPDSVLQLVFCGLRDIVGIILCYLLVGKYFEEKILKFNGKTVLLMTVNLAYLIVWFLCATTPALTDWTYAIRYDYPLTMVLTSFFVSHVVGKSLAGLIYSSIWKS